MPLTHSNNTPDRNGLGIPTTVVNSEGQPVIVIHNDEWWDSYLEACNDLTTRRVSALRVRTILLGTACGAATFALLSALEVL